MLQPPQTKHSPTWRVLASIPSAPHSNASVTRPTPSMLDHCHRSGPLNAFRNRNWRQSIANRRPRDADCCLHCAWKRQQPHTSRGNAGLLQGPPMDLARIVWPLGGPSRSAVDNRASEMHQRRGCVCFCVFLSKSFGRGARGHGLCFLMCHGHTPAHRCEESVWSQGKVDASFPNQFLRFGSPRAL
jgi:hypothetical protein